MAKKINKMTTREMESIIIRWWDQNRAPSDHEIRIASRWLAVSGKSSDYWAHPMMRLCAAGRHAG